jgi:hypothetical protein
MSIPSSFAEGLDKIEYQETGDYLITRPSNYSERETRAKVPFPSELPDEIWKDENQDRLNSAVGNILQSMCVASVDTIEVEMPQYVDDEDLEKYEQAWLQQQKYSSDHLRWDLDEKVMHVKKGLDFEIYIQDVRQYIHQHLIRPLTKGSDFVFTEEYNFEESDYGFGLNNTTLDEEENNIDTRWALATRNIGEVFYNMQRGDFAKGMCSIYIGKYLEMCVDIVKRLVESIAALEGKYMNNLDSVGDLKIELSKSFIDSDGDSFDKRLEQSALSSYNLDVGYGDYISKTNSYKSDIRLINDLRSDPPGSIESINGSISTGMLLGQILTFCERLLRFPRSICHVGVGASQVHRVHIEE